MAPTTHLLPRQLNDNNDRFDRDSSSFSKWAIVGIVIAVLLVSSLTGLLLYFRFRQRRRAFRSIIQLNTTPPNKASSSTSTTAPSTETNQFKYGPSSTGYGATPDQNHALLGNAEAPAIVTWDPSHCEIRGSTQDGFGYDNNLHLAGGIQRPPSVADTFAPPPPRYEEAASAPNSAGLRPASAQGEAASYYNAGASMGEERGRSRSREPASDGATRGRALSIDTRSVNGDRRRSISRFREDGLVDVNVDSRGTS
jgi:hypothetical protein